MRTVLDLSNAMIGTTLDKGIVILILAAINRLESDIGPKLKAIPLTCKIFELIRQYIEDIAINDKTRMGFVKEVSRIDDPVEAALTYLEDFFGEGGF